MSLCTGWQSQVLKVTKASKLRSKSELHVAQACYVGMHNELAAALKTCETTPLLHQDVNT